MIFKQPIIILPQNKIKPIKQKVEIKLFKRKTFGKQSNQIRIGKKLKQANKNLQK